jgi:flavin reductase (DIM6/NTAB) family NADH-FMN oxidoreductase RutF
MFATGVTVLTTRVGEQVHGMTANAFMSVSLRPPLVLISIDRRARMGALLHEGTRFGVSVLEARQTGLSDRFAGRVADDPPEATFEVVHETPLVEGALAHLVARVVRSYWGGDHSLFLGQVEFARYGDGRPLLFHGGRYERLIEDPRVFSQLPRELLDPILALGEEREYADGEPLMRIGEAGCDLMLVVDGTVRVERPGFSSTLGPGELIGEIEVLDPGGGRIADIHAVGTVRAIAVSRDALLGALEADPRAAVALIEVLAARFRETT